MKAIITHEHLQFVKKAQEWRDKTRDKGHEPKTYRDKQNNYIALFADDDIHVFELAQEVAYFSDVRFREPF